MKSNILVPVLTVLNAGMLALTFMHGQSASAAATDDGILRGRGLQIVDDGGKVRASIQILPASVQADGSTYPETVLLRLITEQGRPSVKVAASEQQSGLSLAGPTGTSNSYITAFAGGETSKLIVQDESGQQQTIAP